MHIERLTKMRDAYDITIVTYVGVARLWDELYPHAASAGEACRLAGLDPEQVDLSRLYGMLG